MWPSYLIQDRDTFFELMKEDGEIRKQYLRMGLSMEFVAEDIPILEKYVRRHAEHWHGVESVILVVSAYYLGEIFVETIPSAQWTVGKSAVQEAEVLISKEHQMLRLNPCEAVYNFWVDDRMSLATLYRFLYAYAVSPVNYVSMTGESHAFEKFV